MQVRDVMSRDVKVVSPGDTIERAARLMNECDCGSLPVGENDRLVGVITDRDITLRAVAKGKAPGQCTVGEVMSSGIRYVFDDERTDAAAQSMSKSQIRRLPVLDRTKRLVGIIALGDLAIREDGKAAAGALREISRTMPNGG